LAFALRCALNSSVIWLTDSLMNVPGPKTTFTGLLAASRAHGPAGPPRGVTLAGALPEMQPSRPSTRSRSEVSTSLETSPRTST
jgi:hypothetical protein